MLLCSRVPLYQPMYSTTARRAQGRIIVSWVPCECAAAQANHRGHLRVSCQHPGCMSVWRTPAHPAPATGSHPKA
jgi:hypothetical protein